MSKKSRLKRKKFRLSRQEFIEFICTKCGLCKPNTTPSFCFDTIYRENPRGFIKIVLPKLEEAYHWLSSTGFKDLSQFPDDELQHVLQIAFCKEEACKYGNFFSTECDYLAGCILEFRKQIDDSRTNNGNQIVKHHGRNKKWDKKNVYRKKKKQNVKKIPASPYFFCNESFTKEIEEILNETDTGEQNPCTGCPGFTETKACGTVTCPES